MAKGKKKPKPQSNTIALNKRAKFDYHLLDKFEAGIVLEGWEVKSLREGKLNLKESYIKDIKNELWLVGSSCPRCQDN